MAKSGFAFHVHHNVLAEWCYDYGERVKVIKKDKPVEEQELRLRLFRLIPEDRLPVKLDKAWEAYGKELKILHQELCPDCPWDGHTIFSKEVK